MVFVYTTMLFTTASTGRVLRGRGLSQIGCEFLSVRLTFCQWVHTTTPTYFTTFSMAPRICVLCETARAVVKRPKTGQQICRDCFFYVFETEVHNTITQSIPFNPGDRVAIGASGGKGTKDSFPTRLCGIYFGVSDVVQIRLSLHML